MMMNPENHTMAKIRRTVGRSVAHLSEPTVPIKIVRAAVIMLDDDSKSMTFGAVLQDLKNERRYVVPVDRLRENFRLLPAYASLARTPQSA